MPHLGILTGLRREASIVRRFLPTRVPVTIARSGARADQARIEARRLIAAGVTHVLSFGLAGGLDPALKPGTLLLPRAVTVIDGKKLPVDPVWHDRALELLADEAPVVGRYLALDIPITEAAQKAQLYEASGAQGLDMESHLLAREAAASSAPLRFLVIRVVCDAASHGLPPAALAAVTPTGGLNFAALVGSLMRHPAQVPALLRLGAASRAADQRLLGCCRRGAATGFGMV